MNSPSASPLAPFAAHADMSRGRLFDEPPSAHRSPFQRDRDRIIHSSAWRRLKHKTQVFVEHEGDYYRTRLTHSIEVAQIARTISRALGLNEDLAEVVALAHDLGHTPFGHTGEEALDDCMSVFGGFDHNAQAFRIVTRLERHYADFDGLNLTWETLEGIAKHNGPPNLPLPFAIAEYVEALPDGAPDLELHSQAGAEAQVAALADDIAYVNHDLHDGLRAELFTMAQAADLPVTGVCLAEVDERYPSLEETRRRYEALRRVFGVMVEDLITESRVRLDQAGAKSADDIRALGAPVIAFSEAMAADIATIKSFLFANMYRHDRVRRMRVKTARVVQELFDILMKDPALMPSEWSDACGDGADKTARARVIADYIAGMTDRFALNEHRTLTDPFAHA